MSEQITRSRFVGPSLPESLVLANYQSWLMKIDHQEILVNAYCAAIYELFWGIINKFGALLPSTFWEYSSNTFENSQTPSINWSLLIYNLTNEEEKNRKENIAIMDRQLMQNLWILSSQINYDLWLTLVGCKTDFSPTK